jgi:hemoglobin
MNEKINPDQTPEAGVDPETEARARAIIEKGFEDAIEAFYAAVREDDVIGPVFLSVVHDWDGHKRTMVDFWSRAVLGTQRYNGMPLPPHVKLKLGEAHFDRWLKLWGEACRATMPEPLADHVGALSANMSRHWTSALHSIEAQVARLEQAGNKAGE